MLVFIEFDNLFVVVVEDLIIDYLVDGQRYSSDNSYLSPKVSLCDEK